jgi:hypothetical protein
LPSVAPTTDDWQFVADERRHRGFFYMAVEQNKKGKRGKGEGKRRGNFAVPMAQFGRGLAEAPPQLVRIATPQPEVIRETHSGLVGHRPKPRFVLRVYSVIN